uniref:ECP2 protein n=1 Tax=Passalora fulva TaxID=5499 RepID=A0A5B8HWI3_PASFU|nr:ECP2 protein [Fulvia fulva]
MLFNAAAAAVFAPLLVMGNVLPRNAGNSPGSNRCDASTFNNGQDFDIPQAPVNDCRQMVENINIDAQFSVSHSWARPFGGYGDCAFNVRVIAGWRNGLVGGADAVDLLTDSVKNFGEANKVSSKGTYNQIVSAEGEVTCDSVDRGGQVRVQWIVASSSYNPSNDD